MYFECWECVWYLYQSLCCHNYTWIYGRICRWKNLCAAVAAKSQLLGKHQISGCRWEGRAKCFGLNSWILEGLRGEGHCCEQAWGKCGQLMAVLCLWGCPGDPKPRDIVCSEFPADHGRSDELLTLTSSGFLALVSHSAQTECLQNVDWAAGWILLK